MTADRPPIPRWALVWTATDWTATGSDRHPAFAYARSDGHDLAAIRATNASMTAWRECAHAWCEAAGYTFAEHFAAREVATGTTEDTCAAVAFTSDGRPVCIPAAAMPATTGGAS